MVDGVLFVVMERLAPQASVRDALDSLKGASVLGAVYNAATLSASDDRYSCYRNYDSGQGAQQR
jgi:protein-tyrosine kinase